MEIEQIHEVLPKRQELFNDVVLVCSIRLASLRVPGPNWLIDEDDVAEIRPSPGIRNGTISAGLPYYGACITTLGLPMGRSSIVQGLALPNTKGQGSAYGLDGMKLSAIRTRGKSHLDWSSRVHRLTRG